jgi:hypothetical protein
VVIDEEVLNGDRRHVEDDLTVFHVFLGYLDAVYKRVNDHMRGAAVVENPLIESSYEVGPT